MARELGTIETLREDFIANVSHEFKTPLTAIEGYAMLLQDESLPAAERAEYAGRILSSSNRLSSLVSNILLGSKLEQDDVSMPVAAFRLDEQIRQALLSLEPLWTEKELALDVELEEVRYTGCERLLYHVWSNLLSNAVKFSPPGGTLTLRLRPEGNGAVFSVTGICSTSFIRVTAPASRRAAVLALRWCGGCCSSAAAGSPCRALPERAAPLR